MPAPSWDLAIVVFFLIGIAFGYILQREKIVATMLSTYVSLVITQIFAGNVQDFFHGEKMAFGQVWIQNNASPFTIRVAIFMIVIMLLSAKGGISGGKAKGILSPIEIIGFSFLTTALILSSIFYFMPIEQREAFMATSRFASFIIKYYLWWVILPVATLIGLGFFKKSSHSSD